MNTLRGVTVRFLEMTSPDRLRSSRSVPRGVSLKEVVKDRAAVAMECYRIVGADWQWNDNSHWDEADWERLLKEEEGELWVAKEGHQLVGYSQLARRGDSVEIHYFGLAPAYVGRGLGGWLLTRVVERCWAMGAKKVVLNTCSLDGPAALPNYLSRGFSIVREEVVYRESY